MGELETLSSFRDPSGTVFFIQGRVLRQVSAGAAPEAQQFLKSPLATRLSGEGKLVKTEEVSSEQFLPYLTERKRALLDLFGPGGTTFEHERIWFPSYVYEWPPEMLYAAGVLTLDIAEASLEYGFGLKDATPYNVLFRGTGPVFVDILSFEKREPGDYIWLPYAQFVRMFLLPLLLQKQSGIGLDQLFTTRAHGLEPEEVYAQFGWASRLRPPLLTEVSLPTWLKNKQSKPGKNLYRKRTFENVEKAQFILRSQLRRLRRALKKAAPGGSRSSHWASYMNTLSYSDNQFRAKNDFVERAVSETKPQTVLDIGCNTGHFSAIAARAGARVVAVDVDPVVVGSTCRRASEEKLDILPLVVNIARPTPATGWRNAEYSGFLSRATGSFELVLMLATLHHLLVTERIPLDEILLLASELTTKFAIIEYVAREDPMFQQIARGRDELHAGFTRESFETACRRRFSIVNAQPIKDDLRWLYLLRKNEV